MDRDRKSEPEEVFDEDGDPAVRVSKAVQDTVFAIGTVVFPVEKEVDISDPESVLISPVDLYIGKHIGQFLSERVIGSSVYDEEYEDGEGRRQKQHWRVLGTMQNNRTQPPPYLWATMCSDDYDAYLKEVVKCGYVIYDVTCDQSPERFNEARMVCDALRAQVTKFGTRRVFILVSSLHSWLETKPRAEDCILHESDYCKRRTKPQYRELQLLERYVITSGSRAGGKFRAYVVGAGAVYGREEDLLHSWFKAAWQNSNSLPIYGDGKNYMPLMYIEDLAAIIQHVMDLTPEKQHYIIAVDPVIPQQEQIVKAIADQLGTQKVQSVPEEDIYRDSGLTTFQADQLLMDLRIQSTFCKDNFNIDWFAEEGFPAVVKQVVAEFRKTRALNAFKILIIGPPASGKTTVAKQLSELYQLQHLTKDDTVESTKALLRDIAAEQADQTVVESTSKVEAHKSVRTLLALIEAADKEKGVSASQEVTFYRLRLTMNSSQNQGFILDGYPETYSQAKDLFTIASQFEGEDAGEDEGQGFLNPQLAPDLVFVLEAPDSFLKKRLNGIPVHELAPKHKGKEFQAALDAYNGKSQHYESSVQAFLDEHEVTYYPIDITSFASNERIVRYIAGLMGKPRNYGGAGEQETELGKDQANQQQKEVEKKTEALTLLESRELEERRKQIQKWIQKLAKVKEEELAREEAALLPIRHYLMKHVVPTLTRGLMEVMHTKAEDPIDFLAEYLFRNNPGGLNGDEQY